MTSVRFSLASAGRVQIDLHNVTGQRVRSLANDWYEAGDHAFTWRRTSDPEGSLPSGVYFLQLRFEGIARNQKVVLVR